MKNKNLRRYLRRVKGWLPGSHRQKKRILDNVRCDVEAWLEQQPNGDLAAIEARFGSPQQIAAACVDTMETGTLLKCLRVNRRIIAAVIITMGLILAASLVTLALELNMVSSISNGYGIEEIEEVYNITSEG